MLFLQSNLAIGSVNPLIYRFCRLAGPFQNILTSSSGKGIVLALLLSLFLLRKMFEMTEVG